MRKGIYISLAILSAVVMNSCILDTRESIYGNGDVVTEKREIGNFNRLKVSSGIDVYIKQGTDVSLVLEADENLHEAIRTEVVDHTLKIYSDKNIRKARTKKVYLEYRELESIRVSSSGDVRGENTLTTDALDIDLSSAGDLRLDVRAKKINCDISSAGDARLSGETEYLRADLSSAGDLNAYELIAGKVSVSCSSAGDARVYAEKEITARSSSAGSIYYKGNAKLVEARTSSAGSVSKRD